MKYVSEMCALATKVRNSLPSCRRVIFFRLLGNTGRYFIPTVFRRSEQSKMRTTVDRASIYLNAYTHTFCAHTRSRKSHTDPFFRRSPVLQINTHARARARTLERIEERKFEGKERKRYFLESNEFRAPKNGLFAAGRRSFAYTIAGFRPFAIDREIYVKFIYRRVTRARARSQPRTSLKGIERGTTSEFGALRAARHRCKRDGVIPIRK